MPSGCRGKGKDLEWKAVSIRWPAGFFPFPALSPWPCPARLAQGFLEIAELADSVRAASLSSRAKGAAASAFSLPSAPILSPEDIHRQLKDLIFLRWKSEAREGQEGQEKEMRVLPDPTVGPLSTGVPGQRGRLRLAAQDRKPDRCLRALCPADQSGHRGAHIHGARGEIGQGDMDVAAGLPLPFCLSSPSFPWLARCCC